MSLATSAQGLLRNVTLQFHLRGWITIPGFPSKKNGIRQLGFVPPALPLYRGRDGSLIRRFPQKLQMLV